MSNYSYLTIHRIIILWESNLNTLSMLKVDLFESLLDVN